MIINNHFTKQRKVYCCFYDHHHDQLLAIAGRTTRAAIVTPIQTESLNMSVGTPCTIKEEE